MKNPIQPVVIDAGIARFKENRIVSHLLDFATAHGCGMNELATMEFPEDDRQQLLQLVGYSLCGYGDSSWADPLIEIAAVKMMQGKTESQARIAVLEAELSAIRKGLRKPVARLFNLHPDDLKP